MTGGPRPAVSLRAVARGGPETALPHPRPRWTRPADCRPRPCHQLTQRAATTHQQPTQRDGRDDASTRFLSHSLNRFGEIHLEDGCFRLLAGLKCGNPLSMV